MTVTAIGLIFDIVGVGLIGFVAPRMSVMVAGTADPRPKTWLGRLVVTGGWILILVGFVCQLLGSCAKPQLVN